METNDEKRRALVEAVSLWRGLAQTHRNAGQRDVADAYMTCASAMRDLFDIGLDELMRAQMADVAAASRAWVRPPAEAPEGDDKG
jgi:hypothetical protein